MYAAEQRTMENGEFHEQVVDSKHQQEAMPLHRSHFPVDFVFGAATAAYQVR